MQAIGRRYARADELGIPFAMTIDLETVNDRQVTLRERDSCRQVRGPVESLFLSAFFFLRFPFSHVPMRIFDRSMPLLVPCLSSATVAEHGRVCLLNSQRSSRRLLSSSASSKSNFFQQTKAEKKNICIICRNEPTGEMVERKNKKRTKQETHKKNS